MTLADFKLDATDRKYMVHPLAELHVIKTVADGLATMLEEFGSSESDNVIRQAERDLAFVKRAIEAREAGEIRTGRMQVNNGSVPEENRKGR